MKHLIKMSSLVTLILMTGLFSCKKEEVIKPEKTELEYAVKIQVYNDKGVKEDGVVIGTQEQLNDAFSGREGVELKKVSETNNLFVPVKPQDPIDNVGKCWSEINAYYSEHYPQWLEQANSTCKEVMVCLTCPNAGVGLFVMYVIKPTSFKCKTFEAALEHMALFNFGQGDYNSEAVANYIKELR